MKTILIANLAGGVGKTSAVQSLAAATAEYGKSALAIDGDPAATLTFISGVENPRYSVREVFAGECSLEVATVKTYDRFTLLPGAARLARIEIESLAPITDAFSQFDLVFIDSPTGPNPILPTLIEIADLIIAPITRDFLSVRGLLNLRDFVIATKPNLEIRALDLAVRDWDSELKELVAAEFKSIDPAIRRDEGFAAAQVGGRSLLSTTPQSDAAADYREVAYGLLEEIGLF